MRALLFLVGLWTIGVASGNTCPAGCTCDASRYEVVCSGLTSVPLSLPPGTRILRISNSNIKTLDAGNMAILKSGKLTVLSLERCNISSIAPMAFYPFPTLRELNLAHNQLKTIEVIHMLGLSGLTSLKLDHNALTEVKTGSFVSMDLLTNLDLSYNQLAAFPPHLFAPLESLQRLDISFNVFKTLVGNSFSGLKKLAFLDLEGNRIVETSTTSFAGLDAIKEINMKGNTIQSFQKGTFSALKVLQKLNLDGNKFSLKKPNLFADFGLTGLTHLWLAKNGISAISPNVFRHMAQLNTLDLSNNLLVSLPNSTFSGLSNLNELIVSNNILVSIATNAFYSLGKVSYLDLSFNKLKHLSGSVIQPLTSLKTLLLNDNALDTIPADMRSSTLQTLNLRNNKIAKYGNSLSTLTALAYLDLSYNALTAFVTGFDLKNIAVLNMNHNSIRTLVLDQLKALPKLQELHIGNNRLQTLAKAIQPVFDKMTTVDLTNNPFHCNCEVHWLKQATPKKLSYPLCTFPAHQQTMDKTSDSQFSCSAPKFVLDSNFVFKTATGTFIKCHATGDPAPRIEWHRFSISHDPSTHFQCESCYSGHPGQHDHRCYCTTEKGTSVPQLYINSTVLDVKAPADKTILQNSGTLNLQPGEDTFGFQCTATNRLGVKRMYFAVEDFN